VTASMLPLGPFVIRLAEHAGPKVAMIVAQSVKARSLSTTIEVRLSLTGES